MLTMLPKFALVQEDELGAPASDIDGLLNGRPRRNIVGSIRLIDLTGQLGNASGCTIFCGSRECIGPHPIHIGLGNLKCWSI
jgi:hypothetical protein